MARPVRTGPHIFYDPDCSGGVPLGPQIVVDSGGGADSEEGADSDEGADSEGRTASDSGGEADSEEGADSAEGRG